MTPSSSTRPRSWWTKRSRSCRGVGDRRHVERLVVEPRLRAGIGVVVSGQRLDQRRLAGAVGADERVDLVRADVEAHVPSARVPAKVLDSPSIFRTGA